MKTLTEGSTAPAFELPDQDGRMVRLADLLQDGPVVLFYYPGAMTSGCTQEACQFRDMATEFEAAGAQPIGISADDVGKQAQFDQAHSLGYPLLSDPTGATATDYGVKRRFITPVKRATFVIGTDQKVARVIASEWKMEVHADEALEAVRAL